MILKEIKLNQNLKNIQFYSNISLPSNNLLGATLKSSILNGEFSLLFFETTISSLDRFGDNILDKIGDGASKISDEIAIKLVELEIEYYQHNFTGKQMFNWINREAARLANWFVDKAIYYLAANALNLHFQLEQNLTEHLQVLQSYGNEAEITSLTRLNEQLQHFAAKWDYKLQEQVRATELSRQFFSTLCEQLQYPTWQQDPEQIANETLSKLAQLYSSKFNEVKISLVVQVLKKLKYKLLLMLASLAEVR